MKVIFYLLPLILSAGCASYKADGRIEDLPAQRFENTGRKSCRIKSFAELPGRIKRMPDFKNQSVTYDSSDFRNQNGKASLFLFGAYDRETKAGYIIQRFILSGGETNQCTIFWLSGHAMRFSFTDVTTQTNWNDIRTHYEAKQKEFRGIFGGGITVSKPVKPKKKRVHNAVKN